MTVVIPPEVNLQLTGRNLSWTTPYCDSEYYWTTHALLIVPQVLYFSTHLFQSVCVYADYIIGWIILLKTLCCYGNKLAAIFESKFVQNFLHIKQHSFRPIL